MPTSEDAILARITNVKRQIKALKDRYGTGIRPSYVSTDLSMLHSELQSLNQQLGEMS